MLLIFANKIAKNMKIQYGSELLLSVYTPLADYLSVLKEDSVTLSFSKVEEITGRTLPQSAFDYRQWWANDSKSQSKHGWMAAKWRTTSVNFPAKTVRLRRIGVVNAPS